MKILLIHLRQREISGLSHLPQSCPGGVLPLLSTSGNPMSYLKKCIVPAVAVAAVSAISACGGGGSAGDTAQALSVIKSVTAMTAAGSALGSEVNTSSDYTPGAD